MCSREDEIANEIREEFCRRVIPLYIIRYLTCLTIQDKEKVLSVEKQNGAISGAEALLERLVRNPYWLPDLKRVLMIQDVGLLDFGEKIEEKCCQLNVTVGAIGECINGHGCGEIEEQTLVKSPPIEGPTVSLPTFQQLESTSDLRERVILKLYDKLFDTIQTRDDLPEVMNYADLIITKMDDKIIRKCIVLSFRMETVEKLDAFWNLYHSGGLVSALARDILIPQRRQHMIIEAQSNGIELSDEDFQIQVYIKESDYIFVRDILTHKNDQLNVMKSPSTDKSTSSVASIDRQESSADIRRRVILAMYEKLFESTKSKDDFPEIMRYVDHIIAKMDETCNQEKKSNPAQVAIIDNHRDLTKEHVSLIQDTSIHVDPDNKNPTIIQQSGPWCYNLVICCDDKMVDIDSSTSMSSLRAKSLHEMISKGQTGRPKVMKQFLYEYL